MNTNDIKVIREATEYIRDYAKSTSPELLSKYAEDAISALDRLEAQQPRVRYRSQVSGLWYETLEAAGDVDCVEVDGVQFCQENGVKCLTQQQPKQFTEEKFFIQSHYIGREHADKLLNEGHERHIAEARGIGFTDGLRYARDHGYIGGLSVDELVSLFDEIVKLDSQGRDVLRTRLTAKLNGTLS